MSLGRRPFNGRWRTLSAKADVDLVRASLDWAGKGYAMRHSRFRFEFR